MYFGDSDFDPDELSSHFGNRNTTTSVPQIQEEEDYIVTARHICRIGSPILILLGTLGNVLTFIVSLRRVFRKSSSMLYLTALSVADTFVLYTGLLRFWLNEGYNYDIRVHSDLLCKLHVFTVYVALDYSVWILVAVTVERFLSVRFPFRAKQYCTRRQARFVLAGIFIFLLFLNQHFLWIVGQTETTDSKLACTPIDPNYQFFVGKVYPWIDFCAFSFIPSAIMILCNVTILRHLSSSRRRIQAHRDTRRWSGGSDNNSNINSNSKINAMCNNYNNRAGIATIQRSVCRQVSTTIKSGREQRERICGLTLMLLTVTFIFMLTTTPIVIYLIGYHYWEERVDTDRTAVIRIMWPVVNILQYFNNAIHFFLYCLTGAFFRRELLTMFGRTNRVSVSHPSITVLVNGNTNI